MNPRRLFRLILVHKDGHVVERPFFVTRVRKALRSIRRQLVGIVAIHILNGDRHVRTVRLEQ
jgi:hypothetical protein